MGKVTPASAESQIPENPTVLIKYEPENALSILAANTTKTLAKLQGAKITNVKTLESASDLIHDAQTTSDEVETFISSLRERIQQAAERFRDHQGFEDFEVTLTIRKWSLRQLLNDGISKLKNERARFLAAEQARVQRENLAKQAEQDRINREAAQKAAAEAKKQGADKQTVAEIKRAVMETPAPVVTSRAADFAQVAGVGLRYAYTAKIIDLKKFLAAALTNEVLLASLYVAKPDIEAAFRSMAASQKESFNYPGMTFEKRPVDVNRRGA